MALLSIIVALYKRLVRHPTYAKVLKWLALPPLFYAAIPLMIAESRDETLRGDVCPTYRISFSLRAH